MFYVINDDDEIVFAHRDRVECELECEGRCAAAQYERSGKTYEVVDDSYWKTGGTD